MGINEKIRRVLGYMMADSAIIGEVICSISAEDITDPYLALIFGAITDLYAEGRSPDVFAVAAKILDTGCKEWIRIVTDRHPKDILRDGLTADLLSYASDLGSGAEVRSLVQDILVQTRSTAAQIAISHWQADTNNGIFGPLRCLIDSLSAIEERTGEYSLAPVDMTALPPPEGPILSRGHESWLYAGDILFIAAAPGCMKSLFALTIAGAIVRGRANCAPDVSLGFTGERDKARVAFVDTELPIGTLSRRKRFVETVVGADCSNRSRFSYFSLCAASRVQRLTAIMRLIRTARYDLVIIDSIRDICGDYNDLRESQDLADRIRDLAIRHKTSIILTSHVEKTSNSARGHLGSQLWDICSLHATLSRKKGNEDVIVDIIKHRNDDVNGFSFTYYASDSPHLSLSSLDEDSSDHLNVLFQTNLAEGQKYAKAEILELLTEKGYTRNTINIYLSKAMRQHILTKKDGGYCLVDHPSPIDDLPED